jgi:hypothetical protein
VRKRIPDYGVQNAPFEWSFPLVLKMLAIAVLFIVGLLLLGLLGYH